MPIPNVASPDFQPYLNRLLDPTVSPDVKKGISLELKDWNDIHREAGEVARYLPVEMPIIMQLLRDGEPSFKRESAEHQTRLTMMHIIERLPHSESLKQYVPDLQTLMIHLLRVDNEELGAICVKTVINFNRTYRAVLEDRNMAFVEWIIELYAGMEAVVEKTFGNGGGGGEEEGSPTLSPAAGLSNPENETQTAPLLPSSQSFKVLVECPIATVLFTNEPDQSMSKYSTLLVPASIKLLQLQVEQQRRAHEESAKNESMWIGVAPDIKNRTAYTDFIGAQTKVMSYIAVVFRHPQEQFRQFTEVIPSITVRLLQDCPAEASATRKDLLIAMRHILRDEIRPLFFLKLDALLDERVLMGNGVASHEGLRTLAYSTLADLIHHSRESLTPPQISRVINAYACNLHMTSIPFATQLLSTKLFVHLTEQAVQKCSPAEAARVLMEILRTCVDKLGVIYRTYEDILKGPGQMFGEGGNLSAVGGLKGDEKGGEKEGDGVFAQFVRVERLKPVETMAFLMEQPEVVIRDGRLLFYTILHVLKNCLNGLKTVEGPTPDAEIMGAFFENSLLCLGLYEKVHVAPSEKDVVEKLSDVFFALHPHVFQELWTTKFPFLMETMLKHGTVLAIPQLMLSKENVSKQLVSIILRHLVKDLDSLGNQDTKHATATLRMFKMCFMAASVMPDQESALVPHIPRLMVDSFPLAAKSAQPSHYYLLLRALFRAIGGHKFDTMYAVVTPLLQELLETLNRLLVSAPADTRDLIAELTLTVPVRLTHLLPYLGYLMKPLVYALRAGPELVNQGLRTLELCVDNLTPEFLDPTLAPVLRELMGALHDILRPFPAPHVAAHTTIRILGKLGGRNRRLQDEAPLLSYKSLGSEAEILLAFEGRNTGAGATGAGGGASIDIGPAARLAAREIRNSNPVYRAQAYEVLKASMTIILQKGCDDGYRTDVFMSVNEGLFGALQTAEHGEHAFEYIRDVTKYIFTSEANAVKTDLSKRTNFTPIVGLHIKALTDSLAMGDGKELTKCKELVSTVVKDTIMRSRDPSLSETQHYDSLSVVHLIVTRFLALCWEESSLKKLAGFYGLSFLIDNPELGERWVRERHFDMYKSLVAMIKDTPPDTLKSIGEVKKALLDVLRIWFNGLNVTLPVEWPDANTAGGGGGGPSSLPSSVPYMIKHLVDELSGPSVLLRETIQESIALLADLMGRTVIDTLTPFRDVLAFNIFQKPLRALPLHRQIGHVDTITYALSLRPPLIPVTDELWRMLNEALAVADTVDENIAPATQRSTPHQRHTRELVTKLRVACLRLLTAAIHLTEFFNGQTGIRQRVIAVYFKSLYWTVPEVKDAASEGLQTALSHQARLPKDLLHSGLMPILTNLADSKRLTLLNLDGLGRLMDLLTNHFKVEIGAKLLDHHRQLADPKMLLEAASAPLGENDEIQKLARLTDIFHRLPHPGAHIFLKELTNNVVASETVLCSTTETPFTAPLAAFFERYPVEAVDYLFEHIGSERHVKTIRCVLLSKKAPAFNEQFTTQIPRMISVCFSSPENLLSGLSLAADIATLDPDGFADRTDLVQALLDYWSSEFNQEPDVGYHKPMLQTRIPALIIPIFSLYLEQKLDIDIIFALIAIYAHRLGTDLSGLTRFLHRHVVVGATLEMKQSIIKRCLAWFDEPNPPKERLTQLLRVIVNPMISVTYTPQADEMETDQKLITPEIIGMMNLKVWEVIAKGSYPAKEPSDALTIELTHLTGLMLQHCPELLHEHRKTLMRAAWIMVSSEDAVVKQTANLLIARFFKAYDSPPKLILKVWISLLRPNIQNEGRFLIRQAVDTLAPVLPLRVKDEAKLPTWVKVTKRFLTEEAGGISPTITIFRIIMRHPELFFPYRDQFSSHMINSLNKFLNSQMADSRAVSLEILEHIARWERRRTQLEQDPAPSDPKEAAENAEISQWQLPQVLRDACINILVRLVLQADASAKSIMVPRALKVLHDLLVLPGWNDVGVRPHIFDRMLTPPPPNEEQLPHGAAALKLLSVSVEDRPSAWTLENLHSIRGWLERPYNSNDLAFDELSIPIISRIISYLPTPAGEEELPGPVREFYTFANNIVNEGTRSGTHVALTLGVLQALVKKNPDALEEFAGNLSKMFTKFARESIPSAPYIPGQPRPNLEPAIRVVKTMLDIWQTQMPTSSEHRKAVLFGLQGLIEKSSDSGVCRMILDMCRDWVFNRADGFPTVKEKSALLAKMTSYEYKRLEEPVFTDFLNLVLEIYKDATLRRTDLTVKLESAFMIGCRSKDPALRLKFVELLDDSLPRSLASRIQWTLGPQTWEHVAEHYWIPQALELLLGSVVEDSVLCPALQDVDMSLSTSSAKFGTRPITAGQVLKPMKQLLHLDSGTAHEMWTIIFAAIWRVLSRKEQGDTHKSLILLLAKDYHARQVTLRRNVVQTLLEGVLGCQPPLALPPFVVKYLGKSFNAWHAALELLQESLKQLRDEETVRDAALDALSELYADLSEEDMFYGLWRRRALYTETNVALSFEQAGLWQNAQEMYEFAQIRARQGGAPFNEQEYCLWEDHWIITAQKLQQWETLTELGQQEGNNDLLLECAWRLSDWEKDREAIERSIIAVAEIATPRRRVFEAFTSLIRGNPMGDRPEFTRLLEDAMQLSLRKWVALPPVVSTVHVPLLQHFQQLVELQEAAQIFHALATTTAINLEKRSNELKVVLQAWRERLPNHWDDISVWSDLVSWRQHVFTTINKKFIPLIQPNNGPQGSNAQSTAGYRGYHEIAWIINRFAHVARKHQLLDVCHTSLSRIYTLPNIEISEAFLKLREQARCHYQVPSELQAGLEVINNTNLMYFTTPQKAEFFTLKGMFIAKLGHNDEANAAFGQAVQMDLNMPKAWAEWGRYNDKMFKENPTDMVVASNAVSCYLQAAGLYKSAKTRPLLIRILWFLSLDDPAATISKAFENFKGDIALWFWITLIPQLLKSLSHRAARHARRLLIDLARTYPQALYYELRTSREEYAVMRKANQLAQPPTSQVPDSASVSDQQPGSTNQANGMPPSTPSESSNLNGPPTDSGMSSRSSTVHPWEFVDEIYSVLKSASPLLVPSLEYLADAIAVRFKPTVEEEIYRFIIALLTEALHHLTNRAGEHTDDGGVPQSCVINVMRLASAVPQPTRAAFEHDLITTKPSLKEYTEKLIAWRDRFESLLNLRPSEQPLDLISHWLSEMHHQTLDDVEVPGQYLEHKDSAQHFVRIQRLKPTFEISRGASFYFRRITFIGHDGTKHSFAIQNPVSRSSRREERLVQLFRIFNASLARRKESRRRNLQFYLPHLIPVSGNVRAVQNDDSFSSLQDIFERQCQTVGITREDPMLQYSAKLRAVLSRQHLDRTQITNLKMELNEEIASKYIPRSSLTNYFARTMSGPMDLWLLRKQFTLQVATTSFMSFLFFSPARYPTKIHYSKSSGNIYVAETIPNVAPSSQPLLTSTDTVPFRLTPNMQDFITENGIQGLLSAGMNAVARCLTEPEFDLEQQLGLFLREEVLNWYSTHNKSPQPDLYFRTYVQQNVDIVVRRAETLACKFERDTATKTSTTPATLSVDTLISSATNPQNLAMMPELFLPYL